MAELANQLARDISLPACIAPSLNGVSRSIFFIAPLRLCTVSAPIQGLCVCVHIHPSQRFLSRQNGKHLLERC